MFRKKIHSKTQFTGEPEAKPLSQTDLHNPYLPADILTRLPSLNTDENDVKTSQYLNFVLQEHLFVDQHYPVLGNPQK